MIGVDMGLAKGEVYTRCLGNITVAYRLGLLFREDGTHSTKNKQAAHCWFSIWAARQKKSCSSRYKLCSFVHDQLHSVIS